MKKNKTGLKSNLQKYEKNIRQKIFHLEICINLDFICMNLEKKILMGNLFHMHLQ